MFPGGFSIGFTPPGNIYALRHNIIKINCKPRAVSELVQAMPRRSVIVNEV